MCPPAKSARSDIDGPSPRPRSFGRGSGAPRGVGDPSRTAIRFFRDGEFGARLRASSPMAPVARARPRLPRALGAGAAAVRRQPVDGPGPRPGGRPARRRRGQLDRHRDRQAQRLGPRPQPVRDRVAGRRRETARARRQSLCRGERPRHALEPQVREGATAREDRRRQGGPSAADNGPAVKAVQQALIDLGFEMVRHGRDGSFGGETREAIGLFRQRRGMRWRPSSRRRPSASSTAPPRSPAPRSSTTSTSSGCSRTATSTSRSRSATTRAAATSRARRPRRTG